MSDLSDSIVENEKISEDTEQMTIRNESALKREYYLSNPLRAYGQLRGESMLPKKRAEIDESEINRRRLPEMFAELRETSDQAQNMRSYKQSLRTMLNLNSNLSDNQVVRSCYPKIQTEMLESSKKLYSDISRFNITKPVDVDNVESVLKKTIFRRDADKNKSKSKTNELINEDENKIDLNGYSLALQSLEDRYVSRKSTTHPNSITNGLTPYIRLENNSHRGTIFNYRQAVKSFLRERHESSSRTQNESSINRRESPISSPEPSSRHSNRTRYEIILAPPDPLAAGAQKHLDRVKKSREKVLNQSTDRVNLNKMTILQPFEKTKILVNLDKVPSNVWSCLLTKSSPRYLIPPVRPFGYFKTETSTSTVNQHPQPVKPSSKPPSRSNNSPESKGISGKHWEFESLHSLSQKDNISLPKNSENGNQMPFTLHKKNIFIK